MKLGTGKIIGIVTSLLLTAVFYLWNPFWSHYILSHCYLIIDKHLAIDHLIISCSNSPKGILNEYKHLPFKLGLELTPLEVLKSENHLELLLKIGSIKESELLDHRKQAIDRLFAYGKVLGKESETNFLNFVDKLKKASEDSSVPYELAGDYYLERKKSRLAQKYFEQALLREPFTQATLTKLIKIYVPRNEYSRIIAVSEPHISKLESDYYLISTIGKSYARISQPHNAVEWLEQAIKLKPSYEQNHYLLGKLAQTLDDPQLIDHLKIAYELNSSNTEALFRWLDYYLDLRQYDRIISFLQTNEPKSNEFDAIYLEALLANNDLAAVKQFLVKKNLSKRDYPEIILFEAKIAEKNKEFMKAKKLYEQFLDKSNGLPILKEQALERLVNLKQDDQSPEQKMKLLHELISLNPSDVTLTHRLLNLHLTQSDRLRAIRYGLEALDLFPQDEILLEKVTSELVKSKFYFRNIDLLSSYPFIFDNNILAGNLAMSYYKIGDLEKAYTTLQRNLANGSSDAHLDPNLISLSRAKPPRNDPKSIKNLDKLRLKENQYFENLNDIPETLNKSLLPPPPGLATKINLRGTVIKRFMHRGFAEIHIPLGEVVELIEPMTQNQLDFFADDDDRANYYLAKYKGELHRIHSKYLKIKTYPNGDYIGSGTVTNIDSEYTTTAQVDSIFDSNQFVDIISGTSSGLERTMILDEENFMSMQTTPGESYKIRAKERIYHHFNRDKVSIQGNYRFLSDFLFEDIYVIPSENKLITFGPDMGSVNLFQKVTENRSTKYIVRHSTDVDIEVTKQRYKANFERTLYRGNLILDCNNDNILDYISIWQSFNKPEKGLIHVLKSNLNGSYQDFFLPTDIRHLNNFASIKRISPIHFLKDLDKDGLIEFKLSEPLANSSRKEDFIPLTRYYNLDNKRITDVSGKFPIKIKNQILRLRKLQKNKIQYSRDNYYKQPWYRNYLKAMNKLEKILSHSSK